MVEFEMTPVTRRASFRQKPVPDSMSQRMIDRAEMIQIEHRNGNGAAVALSVGDRLRETVLESLPIRQTGERIMGGEILQARMDFFELARISSHRAP